MQFVRNHEEKIVLALTVAVMFLMSAAIGAAYRGGAEWYVTHLLHRVGRYSGLWWDIGAGIAYTASCITYRLASRKGKVD